MSDEKKSAIADSADLIVNDYAIIRNGDNLRLVNLRTGNAAVVLPSNVVSETSMGDIELGIALDYLKNNLQFLAA